jgi:hypothetical protein
MLVGIVCVGLYVSWQRLSSERVTAPQEISSPLPAPSLAIAAHFELGSDNERSGNLLVTVWARTSQKQGESIPVKLILRRLKNGFLQNHHVKVTDGEASAPYIHGFTSIPFDEPIHIIAEASLRDQHGQYKRFVEEVYLNSRPPLFPKPLQYLLIAVICLLLGIFLWAFTGKSSPLKNHVASSRCRGG